MHQWSPHWESHQSTSNILCFFARCQIVRYYSCLIVVDPKLPLIIRLSPERNGALRTIRNLHCTPHSRLSMPVVSNHEMQRFKPRCQPRHVSNVWRHVLVLNEIVLHSRKRPEACKASSDSVPGNAIDSLFRLTLTFGYDYILYALFSKRSPDISLSLIEVALRELRNGQSLHKLSLMSASPFAKCD